LGLPGVSAPDQAHPRPEALDGQQNRWRHRISPERGAAVELYSLCLSQSFLVIGLRAIIAKHGHRLDDPDAKIESNLDPIDPPL